MFTALYQVAKNTFRESLREPIYLLVLISALCLIGLFPIFSMFVFRAQERLVIDSAMATTMLFGWGVAVLISSYAVSREINNGTARLKNMENGEQSDIPLEDEKFVKEFIAAKLEAEFKDK